MEPSSMLVPALSFRLSLTTGYESLPTIPKGMTQHREVLAVPQGVPGFFGLSICICKPHRYRRSLKSRCY